MPPDTPSGLQVIAMRYRGVTPAEEDERGLDAYARSNVYAAAGLPFEVVEPIFPETRRSDVRSDDLGTLNGLLADRVAHARRAGRVIMMAGGDCTHITGIVGGLQDAHGSGVRVGLVWFDAHGDFNTPQTTLTGSLGGMPVAVCAGLAFPVWRERSHIVAPLPADRILMVDVRNLDPAEESLIQAVGIPVAAVAPDYLGVDLGEAVTNLAERCDLLYLHIDADILDESYVPDHATREPDGPDMAQVLAAVDLVMATGKVAVFAVVSVYAGGPARKRSIATGIELIQGGLQAWAESP